MKIASFIQRYPPSVGGSEIWCYEVSRFLSKIGHRVKVFTLAVNKEEEFWREPPDSEALVAMGKLMLDGGVLIRRYRRSLPIHSVYHFVYRFILDKLCGIYFYGPHSAEMYSKMWREIKNADVVFLNTAPYPHNFIVLMLAKLFGKRTVFVPHFHPAHPHYERKSNYWLLKRCDAVITDSEYESKYLEKKGVQPERLFVAGTAIHPEEYIPDDLGAFSKRMKRDYGVCEDDKVILFLGRKIPEKGVAHLIEAVKGLLTEMPVKLFLVGPVLDWYVELYQGLSSEEKKHIIDMGVLSHQDKVHMLHTADLLVLPSKYEAFGIVFLEAWICGVPVIGTSEGAMPSIIETEGLLSKFSDSEDLKSKIREALVDQDKLKKMGDAGKAKVLARYTWDVIGTKVERVMKSVHPSERILICTNAYPPNFVGGAELIAHQYAKRLKERGFDVAVFAGNRDAEGNRYQLKHDYFEDIPVHRVCLHPEDYSSDFFNFYHKEVESLFDDLLLSYAPDVVHFHNMVGLSVGLLRVAKRRRIRTVLTLHDFWGICFKNTLIKKEGCICDSIGDCDTCQPTISECRWENVPSRMRSDYISLQFDDVDTITSPSSYLASIYADSGIGSGLIRVLPNGIDIKRFAQCRTTEGKQRVRFSFVGYLGRHKGVQTIIGALPLLGDRGQVRINLVGDGEFRGELEGLVKQIGWESSVKFWGRIDNASIESVYRETDVLILPSVWPENQPVSITEAMASGIPVIASRMGGIPELVEHGKTGYLFEAGNPEELAGRMKEFILDRSKLREFSSPSLEKISKYSLDNQVDEMIKVYRNVPSSAESKSPEHYLIVCLGKEVHPQCAIALRDLIHLAEHRLKVVMLDWLDEDKIREAKLALVVDPDMVLEDIGAALRNALPLIVPECNEKLKNVCVNGNCGLYYADAYEAVACIQYLVENDSIRGSLGRNGFKLFYSQHNLFRREERLDQP